MFSSKKQEKGQGLVEYALILVLVAVVVLAVLLILGPIVGNVFSNVNSGLTVDSGNGGGEAAAVGLGCPDIHADGYARAATNRKA